MYIGDLQIRYSGGASNSVEASSLGGAISNNTVQCQSSTSPVNITGITITNVSGCSASSGTLAYISSTHTLTWRGIGKVLIGNGSYTIGNETVGILVVTVVYANLPGTNQSDTLTITTNSAVMFDNISQTEALNGDTSYRCYFIKNSHATDSAYDVRIWINSQPSSGLDALSICLDSNAINTNAHTIITELDPTSVLSGFSFVAPSSLATALVIGDLTAGSYKSFWIRRFVATNTVGQNFNDLSSLSIAALI